jgi:hypothetical protein
MLSQIQRQARRARLKSQAKRPTLKPRLPSLAERKYRAWIAKQAALVERAILAELELRTDAIDSSTFKRLAIVLAQLLSDANVSPFLLELGAEIAEFNRKDLSRLLSIDLRASGELAPQIQRFARDNVQLIRKMSFETLDQIEREVVAATAQQLDVRQLSKILQKRFDVSKSRGDLIARDQTLKLNSQVTQTRLQGLGVTEYTWITSRDERVRGRPGGVNGPKPGKAWNGGNHFKLDGKRFSWNDPPVVDGKGRRAHPGQDFQCRCTASPVLPELDLTGRTR